MVLYGALLWLLKSCHCHIRAVQPDSLLADKRGLQRLVLQNGSGTSVVIARHRACGAKHSRLACLFSLLRARVHYGWGRQEASQHVVM